MQSALPEPVERRTGGRVAIPGIAVMLAAITAGSAATAAPILGLSRLPLVALVGAVAVAVLASGGRRLRWALPLSLLLAIPVSLVAAGWDPWQPASHSLDQLRAMLRMIARDGAGDSTFPDFLVFLAIWANSAWLGWIAIRARRPLIAMVPSAAIIATDVLNAPQAQVAYVLGLVVCCCALLLASAYERSLDQARRRGIWLHDDVRWNYWQMGVAVTVLILAVTVLVPPISTVDRTLSLQNQFFHGAARLPSTSGQGGGEPATGTVIGYSRAVRLLGPLQESGRVVYTYTTNLSFPGPYYFAGNTATEATGGVWLPRDGSDDTGVLRRDTQLPWQLPLQQQLTAQFQVTMQGPQRADPRTVFYPGQLEQANIPTLLRLQYGVAPENVVTVDHAQAANGIPKSYQVTVAGSTATAGQLAAAGAGYPAWVKPYARPLDGGYLPRKVLNQIHALALQAISVAQPDPYDEATAIQNFLRAKYSYTLKPKAVPAGEGALQAFLNHETGGYCVYFATAMADMLRSLGIPVVLVNGFGPGTYDPGSGRYVVRASDAHTWPEVYFPSYGWISFEPTPQPGYGPIPRGGTSAGCPSDICGSAPDSNGIGAQNPIVSQNQQGAAVGGGAQPARRHSGVPLIWPVLAGLLLALLAVLGWGAWWLRPRTLSTTWRRTLRLSVLAGIPADRSQSPLEFGRRLGEAVPALSGAALALADEVTVAAYAPPGTAAARPVAAPAAWRSIRLGLLRRAVRRRLRRDRP